jgi:hypothetical protein
LLILVVVAAVLCCKRKHTWYQIKAPDIAGLDSNLTSTMWDANTREMI